MGGASPTLAANPSYLDIDVSFTGITYITNLNAASGATAGSINLTWTEPLHSAGTPPFAYDVRVSSIAQIPNQAAYLLASPLSSVSPSAPPAPGPGGGAVGFTVTGLTPGVTYFFAITEHDSGALSDQWTRNVALGVNATNYAMATVVASTGTVPMEPLGVVVAPSSTTVTISWSPTTRFANGSLFSSTSTPLPSELQGYAVYYSTQLCGPLFVQLSTMAFSAAPSLTHVTGGVNYYYRLFSFNSSGYSAGAVTVSSLGQRWYFLDDCATSLSVDAPTAQGPRGLIGATNGLGGDIRITRTRLPQDAGNGIYQSAQWSAYLNGVSFLPTYALPAAGHYTIHVTTSPSGAPTPDNSAIPPFSVVNQPFTSTPQVPSAGLPTPGVGISDLGGFWNNNLSFVKMYGRVDTVADTVSLDSPNLGYYQVRAESRSTGVSFDISNLSSRVFTPNGDGINDTIIFTYDPGPNNVVATGRIFNLHGEHVADMVQGLAPNTLVWDGRMNGRYVSGGVYLYRITGGGKTFTGTVVVVR